MVGDLLTRWRASKAELFFAPSPVYGRGLGRGLLYGPSPPAPLPLVGEGSRSVRYSSGHSPAGHSTHSGQAVWAVAPGR
ncbi:hypothetical protein D3879_04560 [Pseudomonas cavernicola]|uniref:Uncharacterized protein n=1 Tax=Pseudomonas cavernicola TaxID=2320866 RepID=A0A418XJG2_9PSED|nr:hypothetical protein D3879_04560 [Pseudomonas cavernicola]